MPPVDLKSINQFKFIHHAFFINGQFVVHGLNHEELLNKSKFLKDNIHRGVTIGGANEYSILYDRILSNIIPFSIKGALWYQGRLTQEISKIIKLYLLV